MEEEEEQGGEVRAPEVNSPGVEEAVCDSALGYPPGLQIADLPQRLRLPRLSHTSELSSLALYAVARCYRSRSRSNERISAINLRHLVLLLVGLSCARRP